MTSLQEKIDAMVFECPYCYISLSKTTLNKAIQELREEIEKTPAETWVIIDGKAKACLTRKTVLSMVGEKQRSRDISDDGWFI